MYNVCACLHKYVCEWAHMDTTLCMWSLYASNVGPHLLPYFWWGLIIAAYTKLASSNTSGGAPVSAFHFPIGDAEITDAHRVHLAFTWVLKTQTQILQFIQQLFYSLINLLLTILNCINKQCINVHWKCYLIFETLGCKKLISALTFFYKFKYIFKYNLVVVHLHQCDAEVVFTPLFDISKVLSPSIKIPSMGL